MRAAESPFSSVADEVLSVMLGSGSVRAWLAGLVVGAVLVDGPCWAWLSGLVAGAVLGPESF